MGVVKGENIATYLCVLNDEMARGENQGNEGCREEHFNDCNIAIITAKYSREGVGVINAKAL
jgi:hypothetical protein